MHPRTLRTVNPLSNDVLTMWLQAITDLEVTMQTPGFHVDMNDWVSKEPGGVCSVCMAGAVMIRRTSGIGTTANPCMCDPKLASQLRSINSMRAGEFGYAIEDLDLPYEEKREWWRAIARAQLYEDSHLIREANYEWDWVKLIRLLREAIERLRAEKYGPGASQPSVAGRTSQWGRGV